MEHCDLCDTYTSCRNGTCRACHKSARNGEKIVGGVVVGAIVGGPLGAIAGGILGGLLGEPRDDWDA